MITARLPLFGPLFGHAALREARGPFPRARRPGPVFIGDAVQPLGAETLLLEIMRSDGERDEPGSK